MSLVQILLSAAADTTVMTLSTAIRASGRTPTASTCAAVRPIERFEPAGDVEPWMTTIGHGPARLPVHIFATPH